MTDLRSGARPTPQKSTTAVKKRTVAGKRRGPEQPQPDLPLEQSYVDRAYQTYLSTVERTAAIRDAPSATPADQRAKRRTLPGEAPLEKGDSVAFGWAELPNGRRYYVGKAAVLDEEKNPLVINWKSKLGDQYMGAVAGDSKGLARQRKFTTRGNTVKKYSDTVFTTGAAAIGSTRETFGVTVDASHATDGSVVIDDAVLDAMEMLRDASMRDIVATIQADQYQILTHDPNDLLLIQGGPGTGKTAVALHRLSWLLYNQRDLDPESVLVVTPNVTLANYIRDVLPALGDDGIRQIAVHEMTRELAPAEAQELRHIRALKGDARFAKVIRKGLQQRIGLAGDRLVIRRTATRGTAHLDAVTVEQAVSPFVDHPYLAGRAAFIDRLRSEFIAQYPLPRRSTFEDTFDVQSLTAQADRVWPTITPHRFLHELLSSRRRLAAAAEGVFTDEEIDKLVRLTAESPAKEKWTEADTFLLHEVQAQLNPTALPRFGHIVVDEAQDLTGMQLQALKRRSRSGAMTLAGDVAQSTGVNRRDSWEALMTILSEREPGQSWGIEQVTRKTLKYVYRVPREAQVLANALQPAVAPDLDVPESLRESGYSPRMLCAGEAGLGESVAAAVATHVSDGRMVGVIAPTQLHQAVAHGLKLADIPSVFARTGKLSDSVTIVAPDGAKGLEFDAVVVVDPNRIYTSDAGPRLLYIALTRTTDRLDLVFVGSEVPELLQPYVVLPEPSFAESEEQSEVDSEESTSTSGTESDSSSLENVSAVSGTASDAVEALDRAALATGAGGEDANPRPEDSMLNRFIEMNARLYLAEIQKHVHPDRVREVVEEMRELVIRSGFGDEQEGS